MSVKSVSSPVAEMDAERAIPPALSGWDLFGRVIWFIRRPSKWQAYENGLKRQLAERGSVLSSVWKSTERREIASQVEEILGDACWGERFSFHPDDPWLIVGAYEIGDLCEMDAVLRIEKRFDVTFEKHYFAEQVAAGLTCGEFVTLIEEQSPTGTATDLDVPLWRLNLTGRSFFRVAAAHYKAYFQRDWWLLMIHAAIWWLVISAPSIIAHWQNIPVPRFTWKLGLMFAIVIVICAWLVAPVFATLEVDPDEVLGKQRSEANGPSKKGDVVDATPPPDPAPPSA